MMTSTPPGASSSNFKGFPAASPMFSDAFSGSLNQLDTLDFDHDQYQSQQQQQQQQQVPHQQSPQLPPQQSPQQASAAHHQQIQQQQIQLQQYQLQQQQIQLQQQFQFQSEDQSPSVGDEMLEFVNPSANMDPSLRYPDGTEAGAVRISPSYSNSTVSSGNSVANPSVSSASTNVTVVRTPMHGHLRHKSVGGSSLVATPVQATRRMTVSSATRAHRRSRSHVTDKSPVLGNNPFYSPAVYLSPKIGKQHRKQTSISTTVSLAHLDTDVQLQQQYQLQQHQSPLATPLQTPHRQMDGLQDEVELGEDDDDDDDEEDGNDGDGLADPSSASKSTSTFIQPSLLMKGETLKSGQPSSATATSAVGGSGATAVVRNPSKFGGRLSELSAGGYAGESAAFVGQDFSQDFMMMMGQDGQDGQSSSEAQQVQMHGTAGVSSQPHLGSPLIGGPLGPVPGPAYTYQVHNAQHANGRIPRTKSMPGQQAAAQVLQRKITRSRSSMNLSEIAATKEARTAALRTHQNFTIAEVREPEYEVVPAHTQGMMPVGSVGGPLMQVGPVSAMPAMSPEYMNVYGSSLYSIPGNALTQYMTPPSTASSVSNNGAVKGLTMESGIGIKTVQEPGASGLAVAGAGEVPVPAAVEAADAVSPEGLDDKGVLVAAATIPGGPAGSSGLRRARSKRSPERRKGKGRMSRRPMTLQLSDFERSKLDLPEQSARSKSRSKKGDNEDKKLHECPLCHSRFQRPEHVKRHMRSHSSEKPFACPQPSCGKRFNRKDNLKQHLRKIHGLKP